MGPELLEIYPRELTFLFELKKQSSDSIKLFNNSDQYIAFKVKTTSPKKYCVRPNIGIVKPKSTRDFTVTMQAQREAPPYMQCKDKFLVQSTIVPYGTKEGDITSEMFMKENGKYIEEKKLRVVLTSPKTEVEQANGNSEIGSPYTTIIQDDLVPLDKFSSQSNEETTKQISEPKNEETTKQIIEPINEESVPETKTEEDTTLEVKNMEMSVGTEILKETVDANYVQATVETNMVQTNSFQNAESKELKDLWLTPQSVESITTNNVDISSNGSLKCGHDDNMGELKIEENDIISNGSLKFGYNDNVEELEIEENDLKSKMDVKALELKLRALKLQLNESECTINKLGEEQNKAIKEIEMLKQELALLRQTTSSNVGQVYDGFPLLFVVFVALVCLFGGHLLRH